MPDLIKKYFSGFSFFGEYVGAAVVSFDDAVKMFEFIIEFIKRFYKGEDFIECFEFINCLLVCFSFEPVVELGGGW